MNGKTIGRVKPAPDLSRLEETLRAETEVQADIAAGRELLTARERSLHRDNFLLKRSLDVERARVAVLVQNHGKTSLAPVGTAAERSAEFERRILAMGDMTPEAREREVKALFDDVNHYREARLKWLADVDAKVAEKLKLGEQAPNPNWIDGPKK